MREFISFAKKYSTLDNPCNKGGKKVLEIDFKDYIPLSLFFNSNFHKHRIKVAQLSLHLH
jgi:hypothetical protein